MAERNIVEDSKYLRELSFHLSLTLDEIGLNTLTVEKRQQSFLFCEHMVNVYKKVDLDFKGTWHHFGSRIEGTTTPGLEPDLDVLQSSPINIIQDLKEWEPGMLNVFMVEDKVAPGYCRLQVIFADMLTSKNETALKRFHMRDISGRIFLKNSYLNESTLNETRHGPATTACYDGFDRDFVPAFKYKRWPRQADEFTRRKRRGSWPSETLTQQAKQHGVFLVPVGHKLSSSSEGELEWRISPSMAERCLMFSLNIVQIKVIVVLKMLVKTYVEPHVRDCISSYHCKTVVLYCSEQTDSSFWRNDNLMPCIKRCLDKLFICVNKCSCPHFILSEENLFDGKVTLQNRCTILIILSVLIRNIGSALLGLRFDGLGQHLQTRVDDGLCVDLYSRDVLATATIVQELEYMTDLFATVSISRFLIGMNQLDISATGRTLVLQLGVLYYLQTNSDDAEQQAVQCFGKFFSCLVVSMLYSKTDIHPGITSKLAYFLENSSIEHLLKFASIFFCNQQYEAAETTLNTIYGRYKSNLIQPVCHCDGRSTPKRRVRESKVYFNFKDGQINNITPDYNIPHCVMFSKHEFHSTPNALRFEFFRSFEGETKLRNSSKFKWMDLAIVDCLPFLFYLHYITYRYLKKHNLRQQSLKRLEQCTKMVNNWGHPETAWNLLGTCLEMEDDNKAALFCFKKSLEMYPSYNAANWHLSTLLCKLITNA